MAGISNLLSLFGDFFGGPKLIEGDQLGKMRDLLFASQVGVVAKAGGGQTGATRLTGAFCSVDTVATAADSVKLPPAIPGRHVVVINNTANSMQVFGVASNWSNGGAGDTIAIQGSTSQVATGTGVAHASGVKTDYWCVVLGQWQRGSVS